MYRTRHSTLLTVDDRDPRITYQGSWFTTTDANDHNSTATGTTRAGSTVQFVFNGTQVTVFGTVGSTGSSSSYTLDDSPPVQFTISQPSSAIYNEPFYSSPLLPAGEHTLTINATADGDYLWLDYLQFTAIQNETQTDAPSLNSTTPSMRDSWAKSRAISPAAISGIVIGTVVLLLVIAGALCYACGWCVCIKRRRAPSPEKGTDLVTEDESPPPTMDIFKLRKMIAARRGATASNSHSSSSKPTESSAIFTSVIFLTPPVSETSGGCADGNQNTPVR
ncbi:hypothetical protein B0H21DRAFT_755561 [Amylocystis lapponica]|nr:hypothetical protein B0H21DRAFT_755561 [Amylocystis lapponica]